MKIKSRLSMAVCAAALLFAASSGDAVLSPASAQVSVDFHTFHDQLAPYGDWVYSDRWGEVWIPDEGPDFHPYDTNGHWAYTDQYGWTWVSDYEWGDIPFHYGRWVNDPDDGWMWVPGYEWSPAWVVWRSNGNYVGWMPMPPDRRFLEGGTTAGISIGAGGLSFSIDFGNTNDDYGYSDWYGRDYNRDRFASNWVFVGTAHVGDRDFHRYAAPRNRYPTIINDTRNVTNYTVVNNYVVNRSINVDAVRRAGGQVQPVAAAQVVRHPQFVTTLSVGRDMQARMRMENPRGTGRADSAPKPPPQIIQTLSTKAPVRNGRAPAHVFTRETVVNAPLPPKPVTPAAGTTTPATNGTAGQAGGTTTPSGANPTPLENRMRGRENNGAAQGTSGAQGTTTTSTNGAGAEGAHTTGTENTRTRERGNRAMMSPSETGGAAKPTGNAPETPAGTANASGPAEYGHRGATMMGPASSNATIKNNAAPTTTNATGAGESTGNEERRHRGTMENTMPGTPSMSGPASNATGAPTPLSGERTRVRDHAPISTMTPPASTSPVHAPPAATVMPPHPAETAPPPHAAETIAPRHPVETQPSNKPNEEKPKKPKHDEPGSPQP